MVDVDHKSGKGWGETESVTQHEFQRKKPSFGWQKASTSSNEGTGLVDPLGSYVSKNICQTVEVSHKMVFIQIQSCLQKVDHPHGEHKQ